MASKYTPLICRRRERESERERYIGSVCARAHACMRVCVCVSVYMYACVCVCVCSPADKAAVATLMDPAANGAYIWNMSHVPEEVGTMHNSRQLSDSSSALMFLTVVGSVPHWAVSFSQEPAGQTAMEVTRTSKHHNHTSTTWHDRVTTLCLQI